MAVVLILDSWPILEWLKDREPAASRVDALCDEVALGRVSLEMSRINYGEVIYSIRKALDIQDRQHALERFFGAPIIMHSVDDVLVDAAADLKSTYAFSYADAFAAALSIRMGVPLVTGDREFRKLEQDGLIVLEWVGA